MIYHTVCLVGNHSLYLTYMNKEFVCEKERGKRVWIGEKGGGGGKGGEKGEGWITARKW